MREAFEREYNHYLKELQSGLRPSHVHKFIPPKPEPLADSSNGGVNEIDREIPAGRKSTERS